MATFAYRIGDRSSRDRIELDPVIDLSQRYQPLPFLIDTDFLGMLGNRVLAEALLTAHSFVGSTLYLKPTDVADLLRVAEFQDSTKD